MSLAERFKFEPDARTVAAGDVIFAEGEPADCMYVVLDGAVEIRVKGRTLDRIVGSTVIGELALIDGGTRSAEVVAVEATTIVAIDRKRFLYLLQNTPTFALDVMALMAERLRTIDRHIADPLEA